MILDMEQNAVLAPKGSDATAGPFNAVKLFNPTQPPGAGPGNPLLVMVSLGNATPGATPTIVIRGGDDVGSISGQEMVVNVGPKAFTTGWVVFGLPTSIADAIDLNVTDMTGTIEAYVGVQTH